MASHRRMSAWTSSAMSPGHRSRGRKRAGSESPERAQPDAQDGRLILPVGARPLMCRVAPPRRTTRQPRAGIASLADGPRPEESGASLRSRAGESADSPGLDMRQDVRDRHDGGGDLATQQVLNRRRRAAVWDMHERKSHRPRQHRPDEMRSRPCAGTSKHGGCRIGAAKGGETFDRVDVPRNTRAYRKQNGAVAIMAIGMKSR